MRQFKNVKEMTFYTAIVKMLDVKNMTQGFSWMVITSSVKMYEEIINLQ